MHRTLPGIFRRRSVLVLAPLSIITVVVAACSPGTVSTPAPIYGGVVIATGTSTPGVFPVAAYHPNDNIKLGTTCLSSGTGGCQGFVSANLSGVPYPYGNAVGAAHLVSSNTGAGGGFNRQVGGDCYVGPCGEGGIAGLAGNATLTFTNLPRGPYNPVYVSYTVGASDYDNDKTSLARPLIPMAGGTPGTQSAPDRVQLNICFLPFAHLYCGAANLVGNPVLQLILKQLGITLPPISSYSEQFSCVETSLTPGPTETPVGTPVPTNVPRTVCVEINVKPRNNG